MRAARLAWSFLTRLPGGVHPREGESLASAVPWFPVVGVALGGVLGATYLGLSEVTTPLTAALVVVGLGAVLTGGFHEDGLADTADAAGGYTPERRLEIMRDSRIGTFGTLALVIATGLKVASLAQFDGADGAAVLVAAHGLGRAAAVAVMAVGPEARVDGLAATSAERHGPGPRVVVTLAIITAVAIGPPTAAAVGGVAVLAMGTVVAARRAFGGTTGDVLGAVEQLAEIMVLAVVAAMIHTTGWLWV